MPLPCDILIIGGGHAGAEAAWAASRLGADTILVTLDPERIAGMSCNPSIGGLAKGQMVREIDALGGLMGIATDNTGIQFRMLNRSKGPAVWGPRAQADKYKYAGEVQRLLSTCPNLRIVRGEVAEIVAEEGTEARRHEGTGQEKRRSDEATERRREEEARRHEDTEARRGEERRREDSALSTQHSALRCISGVILADGTHVACRAVVVTTGTFLRGLMHTGEKKTEGGRFGEGAAKGLSGCLTKLGLELGRLKTGTPPRLHRESIDYSQFELQPGDDLPKPFSYLNEYAELSDEATMRRSAEGSGRSGEEVFGEREGGRVHPPYRCGMAWRPALPQVNCWLGATNARIHEVIRANLHRAPMYSGQIKSTGPRYCPSIEDKVVRFAQRDSHHIFLEPEGLDTTEVYCNGISTSLPGDVQEQIVRLIPGLENAKIIRYGYAVEYDMVWPTQIRSTLETKSVRGLFLAGQINGTSGYEEAAAQGIIAGINAYRYVSTGAADFTLGRDQAYIGVLIDDLVTKPPIEPYRMFTSRAEHRLHLRNDNADLRLTGIGREVGLVDDQRWARFGAMRDAYDGAAALLRDLRVEGAPAVDYLKRAEIDWPKLAARLPELAAIAPDVGVRIEIAIKYEGYIARQDRQIHRFAQLEGRLIPETLDYARVVGLRNEAKQKLSKFTPRSLGQALRISGITPADVTVLAIHLDRLARV